MLDGSVTLIEARDIAPDVRRELGMADDEVAVEGPGERFHARLVSAPTAALLRRFASPTTVDQAILDLSRSVGADPFELLDKAAPILDELISVGVISRTDGNRRVNGRTRLAVGDVFAGCRLERVVRDLSDTQVFQGRTESGVAVAVKVVATSEGSGRDTPMRREAAMYQVAAGRGVPPVVGCGVEDGDDYLTTEWVTGVPVILRAREFRVTGDRAGLAALCREVVLAFARLHSLGVLHGDIRPSNVLVDRDDEVWIIDFGLSFRCGEFPPRRSMEFATLEPEAARAILAARRPPTPTVASEQYAIGALARSMVTGVESTPLRPVASEMLHAIAERTVTSFAAAGAPRWHTMEAALDRALAREPADRFRGLDGLAAALRHVEVSAPLVRRRTPISSSIVERTIDMLTSARLRIGRAANVHEGAAGAAWFLYRAALIREEPDLLAAADIHLGRVDGPLGEAGGVRAVLHDRSGVLAIALLVAAARGDQATAAEHARAFVDVLAHDRESNDELFAGRAGDLCALAAGRQAFDPGRCPSPMNDMIAALTSTLSVRSEVFAAPDARAAVHLGMAHGAAGVLYAVTVSDAHNPDADIRRAVDDLAARAVPIGRGSAWPGTITSTHEPRTPDFAPGWCAGSGGMVHLFSELHERSTGGNFEEIVEAAAWHCFEHPDATPNLCCGLAGRAIALCRAHRATGDDHWFDRAECLLRRAVPNWSGHADGLFRGDLGVALAALELERPETATMPLLGPQPRAYPR